MTRSGQRPPDSDIRAVLGKSTRAPAENLLLAALSGWDLRHLPAHCEQVELELNDVLYQLGEPIRYVLFPTACISLITAVDDHDRLEVGLAQGAGPAWRIDAAPFRREREHSSALERGLKLYIYVLMRQPAQTAACTRFRVMEARLARWLPMTRNRAHWDDFHVTREFLAEILGVRRASAVS